MAETKIEDVIVPEIFTGYVIERAAELSALRSSGIIVRSPELDARAAGPGQTAHMPFWNDLDGDDEVLSDSNPLTPGKIDASQDMSVICNRGRAWSTNDLAGALAGDDPMRAIATLVASWWDRKEQAFLLAMLAGIFGSGTGMSGSSLDIYKASGDPDESNFLTGETFVDAAQLMGDAKSKLTAVMMHSAVEASLIKLDMIDFVKDSQSGQELSYFQGKRVIVDDGITTEEVDSKVVYHSFLFGQGAIGSGFASDPRPADGGIGDWYTEYARVALAGTSTLINRRRFIMHPRGIKWTGSSMAGSSPTNAEIGTNTNWSRVFDRKNVRIVRVRHNVA